MQELDDIALLRQYAESKSEDAFQELVARHLNLVYSAAFRQVRDPGQVEDIVQAVFILLAQKAARLRHGTVVAGWLYQTTRLVARNVIRASIRRAHREQEAHMQSLANQTEPDAWTHIAPMLETAMGRLNDKERDAIVLRYFQGKSLQEVGHAFGGSENAAKQRIQRALEKLRRYFAKREIVLTTAIIAGAVSANAIQAAPAGLAVKVTSAAAAGTAASGSTATLIKGALKVMAWTKLKTTAVIGVAVLLTAGTTTVAVKGIKQHKEDAIWNQITGLSSTQLGALPPCLLLRNAPVHNSGNAASDGWASSNGKSMGFGMTARAVVARAYEISESRIANTNLLPRGKFDFIDSLESNQAESLQRLLAQKWGITARREMRPSDVLYLRVGNPNLLKPADRPGDQGGSSSSSGLGYFQATFMPISMLRGIFERRLGVPVIDETGLKGNYNIDLRWDASNGSDQAGLKAAVLEQMGLDLVSSSQPVETLVLEKK